MKVWLDDIRPMPEGFDIHVKTAKEAIELLKTGVVTEISFDHDLGDASAQTGYDVAKYIEEAAYNRKEMPPMWAIHSANPVGRANIQTAMEKADAYYVGWDVSERPTWANDEGDKS